MSSITAPFVTAFAASLTLTFAPTSFARPLIEESMNEVENKLADGPVGPRPEYLSHFITRTTPAKNRTNLSSKYSYLDPNHEVPARLLEEALDYYDLNLSNIQNKEYLSVIDFSKSSAKVRFFIINMTTGSVWSMHVAHGNGSDKDHDGYAEKFSNVEGSNMSSLGVYITAETYTGRNGYSLRMDGMSSTNSNARDRAIVVHGAAYVNETPEIQGRSAGCPAVTHAYRDQLINQIKEGSVIYAGLSGEK